MMKIPEIQRVPKVKIHMSRYNEIIAGALHTTPYATESYLDLVAPVWDILMSDDYQAVMPVPYGRLARYLWRMKIVQPVFCQQLGVFSENEITDDLFLAFYEKLMTLQPKSYAFHSSLTPVIKRNLSDDRLVEKHNYVLKLNTDYDSLQSGYSVNIRRNIKKARREDYEITDRIPTGDFIRLIKNTSTYRLPAKTLRTMERIIRMNTAYKSGFTLAALKDGVCHAAIFVLTGRNRMIHLISASTPYAKKTGAMAFLFDFLIREHAGEDTVLDFEGSELPGVARFFRSFGAENEPYFVFYSKKNKILR